MFKSFFRFLFTLGGLIGSKMDDGADAIASSPAGIRASFRAARDKYIAQFHEVRDAVAQMVMVLEQKRTELKALDKEESELETKKQGAVAKFAETKEAKYQAAFQQYHARLAEIDGRQAQLAAEVADFEKKVESYKLRLTEMQREIGKLDQKEAEAIADIVSSKQIMDLNDRLSNLSTNMHDENLQAIEKARQKLKAKAVLSDQLAGTDTGNIDREVLAAGSRNAADDEFQKLLAAQESKNKETQGATPEAERLM